MSFKIKKYDIVIKVVTGLFIGSGNTGMRIGGVDNEFIRNPNTNEPYIPGSSIKGKIRSLLEYDAGILAVPSNGSVLNLKNLIYAKEKNIGNPKQMENILKLFGISADNKPKKEDNEQNNYNFGITRLSFSDLNLKRNSDDFTEIFEVKPETAIDRSSGKAQEKALRFTERVVSGTEFQGSITLKVFEGMPHNDDIKEFESILMKGLKLLEYDALGGSSSRGYGKVKIEFVGENASLLNEEFKNYSIEQ